MTESSFAKQFLSALDSRPVAIPSDHVEDPRKYPARPAHTLPKMPNPMKKRKRPAPGQEPSIDVTMKSLRNPPLDITCSGQPVSTSILSLKSAVSEKFGIPTDKIRLLLKKKPCPDSKTIRDLVPEGEGEVEFTIMIIGGQAAATLGQESGSVSRLPKATDARGANGETLLDSEFWRDLKAFLSQRLKDEKGAEIVYGAFKNAWDRQSAMQK